MKKVLFLCLTTILLVGCEKVKENEVEPFNNFKYEIIIDDTTCVEYISNAIKQKGGISVRYNQDGTIKVNESCLNKVGSDKE